MVSMNKLFLFLLAAGVLLTGCVSAPPANPKDTAAKTFQPPAGKAGLYISRESGVASSGILLQILVDGQVACPLPAGTYQYLPLEPGAHLVLLKIASIEKGSLIAGQFRNTSLTRLDAQVGENYYYRASLQMGWARDQLLLTSLDQAAGQKAIIASKHAP
jgi:hypothetical protein